jgi:hypothetical protein
MNTALHPAILKHYICNVGAQFFSLGVLHTAGVATLRTVLSTLGGHHGEG